MPSVPDVPADDTSADDSSWSFSFYFDPAGAVGNAIATVENAFANIVGAGGGAAQNALTGAGEAFKGAGEAGANIGASTAMAGAGGLVLPIVAGAGLWYFGPKIAKMLGF